MYNYECWTDGSFKPSTNCGGYASIITANNKIIKKLSRGYSNTTNNRQELMAVLATLQYFKEPTTIKIYSDSQYVVSSINNKHLDKWIKEDDRTKKNMDLWKQIHKLLQLHVVEFNWVKGHNDNKMNELADLYATHASECLNLLQDEQDSYT